MVLDNSQLLPDSSESNVNSTWQTKTSVRRAHNTSAQTYFRMCGSFWGQKWELGEGNRRDV